MDIYLEYEDIYIPENLKWGMASVLCRLAAKTKPKKVFVEDEIFSRNYYPLLAQKTVELQL